MEYRQLGRTGLKVSALGLGTEFLHHESAETVSSVVRESVDNGINYMDILMPSPDYRDNFGKAMKGLREKVVIAGHMGPTEVNGQYHKTRDAGKAEQWFMDLVRRLKTDYIDIAMIQYVDREDEFDQVMGKGGLMELALRLKEKGLVRFIGMSGHEVPMALRAINSGLVDVYMFPINPAFDLLPGNVNLESLWDRAATFDAKDGDTGQVPDRIKLYHTCAQKNIGLVAMKPYAAGWLFSPANPASQPLTPVQCLNYSLSMPGVSSVVPGVKNIEQLNAALELMTASPEAKDYSQVLANSKWNIKGHCMYCNHCLPCPESIDVGKTMQIIDRALSGLSDDLVQSYQGLPTNASSCIECGGCMERCPFGVDVVSKMRRGRELFA